jgi:predicted ABC-type ATPase
VSFVPPQLWVLAGGNGAGKSTYYERYLAPRGLPFVNADLLARKIAPGAPEAASYEASRMAAVLRDSLLDQGSSFCFETVFSHSSKIDFIANAVAHRYQVVLVFIHLVSPDLNVARVAQRVAEGGHNVPEEKVLSRIPRTMQHISTALHLADRTLVYDNSKTDRPYQLVAEVRDAGKTLTVHHNPLPEWANEILVDHLR